MAEKTAEEKQAFIQDLREGNLDGVIEHLQSGFTVESPIDDSRQRPLYYAALTGRQHIAEYLVREGASLKNNYTAIGAARSHNHPVTARFIENFFSAEETPEWSRIGDDSVAHSVVSRPLLRQVTEIFNMASRRHITILTDLKTGNETTLPPTSFDDEPVAVAKALSKFRELKGEADEAYVMNGTTVIDKKKAARIEKVSIDMFRKSPVEKFLDAVKKGKVDEVTRLLSGKSTDVADMRVARFENGLTPLMMAAQQNDYRLVVKLLEHDFSPLEKDDYGRTALMVSIQYTPIALLLIEKGADAINDVSVNSESALSKAFDYGNATIAVALLDQVTQLNLLDAPQYLQQAINTGNAALVKMLLDKGAQPNTPTNERFLPIVTAAAVGNEDIMRLLLAAKADVNAVNAKGYSAIMSAAKSGAVSMLEMLIDAGADTDAAAKDGETALHIAAENGRIEIVRRLIAADAELNVRNHAGKTALWISVTRGDQATTRVLLENGADPNIYDDSNTSPLLAAVYARNTELVRLLAEYGADPDHRNNDGETAILKAAKGRLGEITKILFTLAPNTDLTDKNGSSATSVVNGYYPYDEYPKLFKAQAKLAKDNPKPERKPTPQPVIQRRMRKAPLPQEDNSGWELLDADTLSHIMVHAAIGRRVTEIFNFASGERMIFSENLKTGAEAPAQVTPFDKLPEQARQMAEQKFATLKKQPRI